MSTNYAINITLKNPYTENVIAAILREGAKKGLVYFDTILGETYEESPIIDADQAARKIMKSYDAEGNKGSPFVYAIMENDVDEDNCMTDVHMFFYKKDDEQIELYVAAFNNVKKKDYSMDFSYYIPIFLEMCKDVSVVEASPIIEY